MTPQTTTQSFTPTPQPGIIKDPLIDAAIHRVRTAVGSSAWMKTDIIEKNGVLDLVSISITFKPRGE